MYRNSFAHKNMKTKLKIAEKYSISFMGQSVQQQQKQQTLLSLYCTWDTKLVHRVHLVSTHVLRSILLADLTAWTFSSTVIKRLAKTQKYREAFQYRLQVFHVFFFPKINLWIGLKLVHISCCPVHAYLVHSLKKRNQFNILQQNSFER